jgi:hypothetical protein
VQAQKTVRENSAFQIGTDLAFDEAGHGRAIAPGPGEEGLELLPDDFVKKCLLGLVAFVFDEEGSVGTGSKPGSERSRGCLLEGVQASGVPACTRPGSGQNVLESGRLVCLASGWVRWNPA